MNIGVIQDIAAKGIEREELGRAIAGSLAGGKPSPDEPEKGIGKHHHPAPRVCA